MSRETGESQVTKVSCHICHREVPRADALTAEGQEYLYFFCGQGCYNRWQHGQGRKTPARSQQ